MIGCTNTWKKAAHKRASCSLPAVDEVLRLLHWQAGRPKAITGFQTHTTPVLLSVGERAELASQKYLPLSSVLEGTVILRPNPDYIEMHE